MHKYTIGFFDKVYILNLDKRREQGLKLAEEVRKFGGKPRVLLVGSGELKEKYFYTDVEKSKEWQGNNQTYNYAMCWKQMLFEAKKLDLSNFLFLEDDAYFIDGFENRFNELMAPFVDKYHTQWDMLYLGSNQLKEDSLWGYRGLKTHEVLPGIIRSARARDMHAVAVSMHMYDHLLALFEEKWLPANPSFDEAVCHALHHKHMVYAFKPSLVKQRPGFSYNKKAYDDRTNSW